MQIGVSRSSMELGTASEHSFVRHVPVSMLLLLTAAGKGLPFLTQCLFLG